MSRLVLFNKPYGVHCKFTDAEGRPTLAQFGLPPRVYAAGRLDHDSEGLVLLTDDGMLNNRLTNPRMQSPRTYLAQVEGLATDEALHKLCNRLVLKDGPTLPAQARRIDEPMTKTNAVRLLERDGVPHELRAYEVDPDDLAAETVAAKIGMPPAQVFKTLVVRGDRSGVLLAVVPGDQELDPKALARATGDRKVEPVKMQELQPLTGYIRGGVTAIACKKAYPVIADATIRDWPVVSVSAGTRGVQILIAPEDYLRVVNGTSAPIARPKGG